MHEMTFAQQILESVLEAAGQAGARRVETVRLCLGERLGLEPRSLQFCLEAIGQGTAMQGARLEMTTVGNEMVCERCGRYPAPLETNGHEAACARCAGPAQQTGAMEIIIEELEIDDDHGEA